MPHENYLNSQDFQDSNLFRTKQTNQKFNFRGFGHSYLEY